MTYNRHIFNLQNNEVIRDFEGAYKNFDNVYPAQFQIESPKFRLIVDKMKCLGKSAKLLDIGAGYGAFVNYLQNSGIDAVGVDISPTAVEKGKKLYGDDLNLLAGDLVKGVDFPDENFDFIVCHGVLTWLLDRVDLCLAEIKRLLKAGGYVALSIGFKDDNIFFKDIVSGEKDFLKIISKHFFIEDFFVYYHEIGAGESRHQNFDLPSQSRDFVVFARRKAA